MCRIRFSIVLPILSVILGAVPAAAQDDPGARLEVGEGVRARIDEARGVPADDLPGGAKRVSKTYRLEISGDGHLTVLLPYDPAKVEDPARLKVAVVGEGGVTYHPCRVRPEMNSVQLPASDLPAARTTAQVVREPNALEARFIGSRNNAQLQADQIEKLLAQHGLSRETYLLEYQVARERWLEVRREHLRTSSAIRLLEKLTKRSAEKVPDDEEARKVGEELWVLQGELARRVQELGPKSAAVHDLKAKIEMLENRQEILRKSIGSRQDGTLATLRDTLEVQLAEMAELDARVRELGELERRVAALTKQLERYEAEAERCYARWERLQSERESEDSFRTLRLTVVLRD